MVDNIEFETVDSLCPEDLLEFYRRQGCPTGADSVKLQKMVDNTFCFVAARIDGRLVGLARGVTDGVRGWLAECKLDPAHQGPACITRKDGRIEDDSKGIGREMARRVLTALCEYGVERIETLAYGTEVDFCEELGFRKLSGVVPLELDTEEAGFSVGAASSHAGA